MVEVSFLFLGYVLGVFVAPQLIRGLSWVVDLVTLFRIPEEMREYAPSIYDDHIYGYSRLVAVMCWPLTLVLLLCLAVFSLLYHGTSKIMTDSELTGKDLPNILPFCHGKQSPMNGTLRPYRPDDDKDVS